MSITETIRRDAIAICAMAQIAKNYGGFDLAAANSAAVNATDEELLDLGAKVFEANEAKQRFNDLHWEVFGCESKAPWQIGA